MPLGFKSLGGKQCTIEKLHKTAAYRAFAVGQREQQRNIQRPTLETVQLLVGCLFFGSTPLHAPYCPAKRRALGAENLQSSGAKPPDTFKADNSLA